MRSFDQEIKETQEWFDSPRFAGIVRPYTARQVVEQRGTIGEAADGKAMPRQFATDNFTVVHVVFNNKDADGTRIALLVDRVGLLENWEGSAHGAGGRSGKLLGSP